MKPILLFDIDETILFNHTMILDSTVEAIRKARENGAYAFINTGRSRAIVPKEVIDIGFDGMICGCGTYVEFNGEEIFNQLLTEEQVDKANEVLNNPNICIVYEGPEHFYYKAAKNKEMMDVIEERWERDPILSTLEPYDEVKLEINKLSVYFLNSEDIKIVAPELEVFLHGIPHGTNFLEYVPKGFSKAIHYETILRSLPDAGTIYAFGDSLNDFDMIQKADVGVAMGNAYEQIKEIADYTTESIDKDGLALALKHFELI